MSAAPRMRHHAYSSFIQKLLARDILLGQFLSQCELVELTGMPLGAIREMILRIEDDGLLRTVPKRWLQVVAIDINLIRDAFQLRQIIESEALAAFCRDATATDIVRIAAAHRRIVVRIEGGVDYALLDEAQHIDWAFHDLIVDAMSNRILSEVHRVNSIKILLTCNSHTRLRRNLVASVMAEHMPIIEALEARNEAEAVVGLQKHIDSARRRALNA